MIVTSRTPLRVSLFGGGSDYPDWYERRPGAVLGFTIDKYIYISALRLTAFVDYRYRLSYSQLEFERDVSAIRHPAVRAILEQEHVTEPLDCSIQADLPANAGLGSSSAFTVGFLHLVSALKGTPRTRLELAEEAIKLEQDVLNERVGVQDQLHAAFGGLNRFDFHGDQLRVTPLRVRGEDLDLLCEWMLLVYTGSKRHASDMLGEQLDNTVRGRLDSQLSTMVELVDDAQRLLEDKRGDDVPVALAGLLEEAWRLKASLSSRISTPAIEELYRRCGRHGALGGKLCGAGAGGFLLLVVPPDARARLVEDLGPERCVMFRIEHTGSTVRQQW